MLITNTGGRDVVISKIEVHEISATFGAGGNVYNELNVAGNIPGSLSAETAASPTTGTQNVFGTGDTTTKLAISFKSVGANFWQHDGRLHHCTYQC